MPLASTAYFGCPASNRKEKKDSENIIWQEVLLLLNECG